MSGFAEVVDAIGGEAAEKLIEVFGGGRIYIPVKMLPNSAIACAIGSGPAAELSRLFGGDRFEVSLKLPGRRQQITALLASGKRVEEIAAAVGCSRRRVQQVLAETRTKRGRSVASLGRSSNRQRPFDL